MKAVKKIEISVLYKRPMPLVVYTMQGDTGREIECTVVDWDIPAGATARVWVVKPSKKVVYSEGGIMENSVVFSLTNQMLAEPGVAICIIEFASGDDVVSSFPFNLCIDGSARGDGIPSGNESTVLEGMFEELAQDAIKALDAAKAEVHNVQTAAAESIKNIETIGKTQIDAIKEAGGGVEQALSNYFALRRNGLVFTTKIYKYTTSTSPVGVKMNANENMVCEPSIGRRKGRDDYEQYGLFHHFTCNFSVDENGFNHVDALEGQTGFTKYGKVQVGEVTMSAWFGIEDTAEAVLYHYSDSQTELTPHPMKESINPDGTLSPFMIHAKYAAGDIDGMPYSSKGLAPANGCQAAQAKNPISYTGMIAYMHKLGGHYCGTTSWDLFYRQLMMIIKYATTHSQSIMAGCTSYSAQHMNLVAETGVTRVILTKSQAASYVVGSYVSIGEMGEATNNDRYYAYMHNLAYSVKILKIEDVDDVNAAIYVDAPEAFDTTLTTCISTMPWHSGSTDEVAGSDGSLGNNTRGIYAFKIQGIETGVGAYEVLGNVVMDIVAGADGNPARDVYVCQDASTLSSNIATVRTSYRKAKAQVAYTAANWRYISEETTDTDLGIMIPTGTGAGSTTGFADGLYTDTETSGQREWLALGVLSSGAVAGLWGLFAYAGWSYAYWHLVSGVSPNGTRGEWQAAA
ncbi:hypothetical protein [Blautia producta]|uniref:BppU N-terminal domain-containing protein n=1 Tax=Blautia producta ATCC 27340 = DSM 2950 TaxID=1121114 RepID=A0ABX6J5P5_9FIRM|nr:hypothetical protein [Blautia producta]QIB54799.1 hypothetical protein GXM18_07910 [Blautia producta ATCC 27340 = DSM 2950]